MGKRTQADDDRMTLALRTRGLRYPGAHLKSPWPGHKDLAVNNKTFCYLGVEGEPFKISCKLPHSGEAALEFDFCVPTGYGLGRSGWVSASFAPGEALPPIEMFEAWIDESYRAQALKRQIKALDASGLEEAPELPAKRAGQTRRKPAARGPSLGDDP